MRLPHSRPWLIELADQPFCPPSIREAVQTCLTFMWTHRISPFQSKAPYELASDVLEQVMDDIADDFIQGQEERETGRDRDGQVNIGVLDCCSGAGGPVAVIEKRINSHRQSLSPIHFTLSDLHPPLSSWSKLVSQSQSQSLSYISQPVDATQVSLGLGLHSQDRHRRSHLQSQLLLHLQLRTFFLSFHHFNDELARGVLVDAMRDAEGICIFELQEPTLGSLITIAMLFPLTWLLTPFQRPSLTTLFFTYIIPIIPLILVIDGFISAYRTRSISHILHLANLAALSLHLEGGDKGRETDEDGEGEIDWKWDHGRVRHTWPWGYMTWVVGRRDRKVDDGVAETEVDEEL